MNVLLHTRELQTGYHQGGRHILVSGVLPELTIGAGQLICLLGPNGSGKSTLLRTLAGLQPPLGGRIEIEGRTGLSSNELAKKISLVLTDRVTGNNLDVYSLVALVRYPWSDWLGGLRETDRAAIDRAIESAGIAELLERRVFTLSDGENQKVMLARALAQDTPILMLDEPTAHLDLPSRIRLMRLLHRLAQELNKGILLSTQELDLALQVADEVWLMQAAGPFHKGTPEDLILDGIFEAVFAREDVAFDRAAGVFRIPPEGVRRIRLTGDGVPAFWTRRALMRAGFVVEDAANAGGAANAAGSAGMAAIASDASSVGLVRIVGDQDRPAWELEAGDAAGTAPDPTGGAHAAGGISAATRFESIAGLLEALRHSHRS